MAEQGQPSPSKTSMRTAGIRILFLVVILCAVMVAGSILPYLGAASPTHTASNGRSPTLATLSPLAFEGYNVTFHETGLPHGTTWSVTFNGTVYSGATTRITVPEVQNATGLAWNTSVFAGYDPTPVSGTVNVAGAPPATVTITFAAAPPPPGRYTVTFHETGLAARTAWGVTFNGTFYPSPAGFGSATITITNQVNNTYLWNTTVTTGLYPTPPSGSIKVSGSSVTQNITFGSKPGTYTVTFNETGLPFGTTWGVTFNTSYYVSNFLGVITITSVGNGSYAWNTSSFAGLYPSPPSGSLKVNGAAANQTVVFGPAPGFYTVTFSQTGLPFGTAWSVTFNSTLYPAPGFGNLVIDNVTNGTYKWNVTQISGYTAAPPSGSITVNGGNQAKAIVFTVIPGEYAVDFDELGLPGATTWSVTFNGSSYSSATPQIAAGSYPNGTYTFSVGAVAGYTASPIAGSVKVSGAANTTLITFTALPKGNYSVTFTESGLLSGTSWSVTLNGSTLSSGAASIAFSERNATLNFSVGAVSGYSASPPSGQLTVNGAAVTQAITFTLLTKGNYSVTFTESGLPHATSWSVTMNGSTESSSAASIIFSERNATLSYSVGAVPGYSASPPSGHLTVNGAAVSQTITFTPLPKGNYSVTFTESGLLSGTSWSVTLNGSTMSSASASIGFSERNATLSYSVGAVPGYTASPPSGQLTVNGAAVTQAITFTPLPKGNYSVTFTESGLSSGTSWSVTLNGSTQSSTVSSMAFSERNATLSYSIGAVPGYSASPPSGHVTVDGAAVSQAIAFTLLPKGNYSVAFTESGLPSGTSWSVTLNGSTQSSTSASIVFSEKNATLSYSIGAVSGYTASPSSGHVIVDGAAVTQAIDFSKGPQLYSVTFSETGLPASTNWSVKLNGSTMFSKSASIVFSEPNGTYTYTVSSPSGYTAPADELSNSVTVSGAAVSAKPIAFTSSGSSSTTLGSSLYTYIIILVVVVVVVALIILLVVRRKKSGEVPPMVAGEAAPAAASWTSKDVEDSSPPPPPPGEEQADISQTQSESEAPAQSEGSSPEAEGGSSPSPPEGEG